LFYDACVTYANKPPSDLAFEARKGKDAFSLASHDERVALARLLHDGPAQDIMSAAMLAKVLAQSAG